MKTTIKAVRMLCVNGGRFAEVETATGGTSINVGASGDVAARLFDHADTETIRARECLRRARVARAAAWHVIRERAEVSA